MEALRGPGLGLLLLAAAALASYAPPGAAPFPDPGSDPALWQRLFPGVPAAWSLGRLAALVAGAAWLSARVAPHWPTRPTAGIDVGEGRETRDPLGSPLPLGLVGLVAAGMIVVQLVVTPAAGPGEWGVLLGLLFPVVLWTGAGCRRGEVSLPGSLGDPWLWALVVVVGAWLAAGALPVFDAPLPARLVDLWQSHLWVEEALAEGAPVLRGRGQPGVATVYMLGLGHPWLPPGGPALLERVLAIHAGWLAAAGLGLGVLARRLLGPCCGPAAAALFLFSPFTLALRASPSPFGIFLAFGVLLLLLLHGFLRRPSSGRLLALACVAGLSTMSAYLYPLLAFGGVSTAWRVLRGPRPGPGALAVAGLCFVAAALPSLPGPEELRAMSSLYVDRQGAWAVLEAMLLGQRDPFAAPGLAEVWSSGRRGPIDLVLETLLSPLAVPRTPLRLWGDTLLEPVAAALAALGIACTIRRASTEPSARWLLVLLGATLAPAALASAYDRASLLRNLFAPPVLALLAAGGIEALRATSGGDGRARAATLVCVGGALAGIAYFSQVALPRLPSSSVALAIEALEGQQARAVDAAYLDFGGRAELPWLHVRPMLEQLPRRPIRRLPVADLEDLERPSGRPSAEVFLWSPGLEARLGVGAALCERWPRTEFTLMVDRSGRSRLFAGRPGGSGWRPALPTRRFGHFGCERLPAPAESSSTPPRSRGARRSRATPTGGPAAAERPGLGTGSGLASGPGPPGRPRILLR